MSSWSAPVAVMANTMDNLQQDPQVAQMMLGLGPAYDVLRNVPIDLLWGGAHFESEVEGSLEHSNPSPGQQPGSPA